MKIVNVSIKIKVELQKEYEKLMENLVKSSQNELDNIRYNHFKKIGSNNEYAVIEHWKDDNSLKLHMNTPHFKEFSKNIDQFVVEEPEILIFNS